MKKVIKKILIIIAGLLVIGSITLNGITLSKNSKLKQDIKAITEEKVKVEEELRICGEDVVQLQEKNMSLEGQVESQKAEIEKLNKEITSLKKN